MVERYRVWIGLGQIIRLRVILFLFAQKQVILFFFALKLILLSFFFRLNGQDEDLTVLFELWFDTEKNKYHYAVFNFYMIYVYK